MIDNKKERNITSKVKNVLEAKKENPTADNIAHEAEIDLMVYKLYNLT